MDEADPEDLAWGPIPGDERIKFLSRISHFNVTCFYHLRGERQGFWPKFWQMNGGSVDELTIVLLHTICERNPRKEGSQAFVHVSFLTIVLTFCMFKTFARSLGTGPRSSNLYLYICQRLFMPLSSCWTEVRIHPLHFTEISTNQMSPIVVSFD